MQHIKNKWFTLVELIVVITILIILWTIAFISLQWYTKSARNSTRISDIKNTVNVLELFSIKTGKYPLPWNAVDKTASWGTVVLWQSWDMDIVVQRQVERLSKVPLDPTTGETMKYATTLSRKEYELKYDFELAQNSVINTSYAEETAPYVKWNYNGLYLLADNNTYYSVPWLHTSTNILDTAVDFELNNQVVNYQVWPLTNSWVTLTKTNLSTNFTNFALALKTSYASVPELNDGLYSELINIDASSAELFIENLLDAKAEAVNACAANPWYTNTTFTAWSPANDGEAWQNTNSGNSCYYECTWWYTWNDCSVEPLYWWRALDSNCDIEDISLNSQVWAWCNSTLWDWFEWGKQDNGNNGTIISCYNYSSVNNATCTIWDVSMASNTKANTWFAGSNANGDQEQANIWWKLYTWNNRDSACGTWYHVPSDAEWEVLETYLNGWTNCRIGQDGWKCSGLGWEGHNWKTSSNNIVEALKIPLTWYRTSNGSSFTYRGSYTFLWSSTESAGNAYYRRVHWDYDTVGRVAGNKWFGYSVRCIRD